MTSAFSNLQEAHPGAFHHSAHKWVRDNMQATRKQKHLAKGVNVAYICWVCIQDLIKGENDCGGVQCRFIKRHIRKKKY